MKNSATRNPERIPRVLEKLQKIWEINPDLRFLQLIYNLEFKYNFDTFYTEDGCLERELDRELKKLTKV